MRMPPFNAARENLSDYFSYCSHSYSLKLRSYGCEVIQGNKKKT